MQESQMLDVVYIGLTVVFFVAVAALAKGVERLGRPDLSGSIGPVGSGAGGEVRR